VPKRSPLLLLVAMLVCPLHARADTLTVGFWDAAQGVNTPVTTLASVTAPLTTTGPIIQLLPQQQGQPLFVGPSGFGFDQIIAMVIPPSGNLFSGGLGGLGPTFEFSFNDGFAPPQGGNIRLYATWQGAVTAGSSITLPSYFAVDELPPGKTDSPSPHKFSSAATADCSATTMPLAAGRCCTRTSFTT
jgi:hypothetical protein